MSSSMQRLMLTHVGHRRLLAIERACAVIDDEGTLLNQLASQGLLGLEITPQVEYLIARGWMIVAPAGLSAEDAHVRYRRNPLEHVEHINFEITNQCNFKCLHCRNGGVEVAREKDMAKLEDAGRLFLSLGIRRFDFIGGEVTRYGSDWLDLSRTLRDHDSTLNWPDPLKVTVYTNGWWLNEKGFDAAERYYHDESAYLVDLKAHGVSHILFSIDGPAERHDRWRCHPGLFQRILESIPRIKAAGLAPRLSVVTFPMEEFEHLRPFAKAIYDDPVDPLGQFAEDRMNHVSNFIDSGNAADHLRAGHFRLSRVTPDMIRCKAFFRPRPTLRIMSNGALGICPLMLGEEGYGNIHDRPLLDILNHLEVAPLYRLHASGEIGRYLQDVDPAKFATGFDHLCAVRIEVNRRALADLMISPR